MKLNSQSLKQRHKPKKCVWNRVFFTTKCNQGLSRINEYNRESDTMGVSQRRICLCDIHKTGQFNMRFPGIWPTTLYEDDSSTRTYSISKSSLTGGKTLLNWRLRWGATSSMNYTPETARGHGPEQEHDRGAGTLPTTTKECCQCAAERTGNLDFYKREQDSQDTTRICLIISRSHLQNYNSGL